ncbi:MAG: CRISPR-associated RAMP protein Csx7 [Candidatus Aenigmatarchaeota archaeon]
MMYIKDLDEIKIMYEITGILINQTPLSIGAGKGSLKGGIDNPIIRIEEKPYIPGSSLKGVLRSEAERYVKFSHPNEFVCDILNPNNENTGELSRKIQAEKLGKEYEPCIICRIFGGPTIASHLTLYNALPSSTFRTETKTSVSISRVTGGQYPGRLYDVEYVVPLTKFEFKMRVDNIDLMGKSLEAEVVNYLIKILTKGEVWLGGRKSIGMGNVKLTDIKVVKIEFKDGKISEEDVTDKYFSGGV